MKRAKALFVLFGVLAFGISGCGQNNQQTTEVVEFEQITPEETVPIIIREEQPAMEESFVVEEASTMEESETEEEVIVPYVDRVAGEYAVTYSIETAVHEDGVVKITYPQLAGMENTEIQANMNEAIKQTLLQGSTAEELTSCEYSYEIASKGAGIVSFVFRGYVNYEGSAYPTNVIKTLNLNLVTGENMRLTDYADMATVVSALETATGYDVVSSGVDKADFSAFMNNGYVTDYAMTMLDYDVDLKNPSLIPTGFSCIRDNHLVLFVETEHAMGDYVEIIFDEQI